MTDATRKLLFDVREAGYAIQSFVQDMALSQYLEDLKTRSAVERQFEILGEAFVRLRDIDPESFRRFPQAPRIIGFRNRLSHGYDTIDQATVLDVVQRHLPGLLEEVEKMLPPDGP
jgi:uncharacterized protein with HEPN domain